MNVAVCGIAKNENYYIRDWVEHYLNIGVDNIFIYDNNDLNGERFESVIGDYIDNGFVKITNKRGEKLTQPKCYETMYNSVCKNYDFACFFDIDEFLEITDKTNIKDFLSNTKFDNFDTILVNWELYGDSDCLFYENKNIKERFLKPINFNKNTKKFNRTNYQVKSIVRCNKKLIPNLPRTHKMILQKERVCDSNGCTIRNYKKPDMWSIGKINYSGCKLKHYITKSCTEFAFRQANRAHMVGRTAYTPKEIIDNFFQMNDYSAEKVDIMKKTIRLNKVLTKEMYDEITKNEKNNKITKLVKQTNVIEKPVSKTKTRIIKSINRPRVNKKIQKPSDLAQRLMGY